MARLLNHPQVGAQSGPLRWWRRRAVVEGAGPGGVLGSVQSRRTSDMRIAVNRATGEI